MKKFQTGGFALVEALVAIVIIGIIGFILAELLSGSFRGSDKTKLVSKVVQNGQVALSQMEQTIRNSNSIVCIGNLPTNSQLSTSLTVLSKNSEYLRYSFIPPGSGTNGYIQQETLNVTVLPQNPNNFCQNPTILDVFTASAPQILTDSSPNGVSITTAASPFINIVQPGFNDAVTINFQVGPPVNSKSGYQNQLGGTGTIDFKTTVQLR